MSEALVPDPNEHSVPARALPSALPVGGGTAPAPRATRLRAPLLLTLGVLLVIEGAGGILIFFARLAAGRTPGEALHVAGGALLAVVYAVYQGQHWSRVTPWRNRLDYALGLIAALSMAGALGTGLWLAGPWWQARVVQSSNDPIAYAPPWSAAHNIMSMLVLTFVGAHLAAVLLRDRASKRNQPASVARLKP